MSGDWPDQPAEQRLRRKKTKPTAHRRLNSLVAADPGDIADDLGLPLLGTFRDGPASLVPLLDVRRRGADRTCEQLLTALTEAS